MKNKKLLAKLIFVAILLLIIWYTFKDSAEDIVEQLGKTSLTVLVGVHKAGAITVLYRVATFIFPFVVGGVLILISKVVHRHK